MSEGLDEFNKLVSSDDLRIIQEIEELRQMRLNINALFAFGSEEIEEPEEN